MHLLIQQDEGSWQTAHLKKIKSDHSTEEIRYHWVGAGERRWERLRCWGYKDLPSARAIIHSSWVDPETSVLPANEMDLSSPFFSHLSASFFLSVHFHKDPCWFKPNWSLLGFNAWSICLKSRGIDEWMFIRHLPLAFPPHPPQSHYYSKGISEV